MMVIVLYCCGCGVGVRKVINVVTSVGAGPPMLKMVEIVWVMMEGLLLLPLSGLLLPLLMVWPTGMH